MKRSRTNEVTATENADPISKRKTTKNDAAVGWRSALTGSVGGLLLFELVSGLLIYLAPFSEFTQFSALLHSLLGIAMLLPVVWYVVRHWRLRKKALSHNQTDLHFGLGEADTVDEIVIRWPDGVTEQHSAVAGDRIVTLEHEPTYQ